jgi:2,4-dienoyl-CoA reductase-like NADH-dependent reductase (Old Yellow Enzyme family)
VWCGGEKPLFVRLSAAEGPKKDSDGKWLQWVIEQTILLTGELKKLGLDLIDVSGGNWPALFLLSLRRKKDDMDIN